MPAPAPAPISATAATPIISNFLNLPFFLGSASTLSLLMVGPFLIRQRGPRRAPGGPPPPPPPPPLPPPPPRPPPVPAGRWPIGAGALVSKGGAEVRAAGGANRMVIEGVSAVFVTGASAEATPITALVGREAAGAAGMSAASAS